MYVIECKAKNNGEVFFYTTRSGRHDIGPRVAAHEFSTWIEADQVRARFAQSLWSEGLSLQVVDGRRDAHVAGQSHSD